MTLSILPAVLRIPSRATVFVKRNKPPTPRVLSTSNSCEIVMSLAEKKAKFMSSPHFAVLGASKDERKVGTKILKWYQERSKDIVPVHPKEAELEGLATIKSLHELKDPNHTSVSVVTPAKVTIEVLKAAKELNIPAVWCQPGTTDETCETFIRENGMDEKVIFCGPCVLVVGDNILASL